MRKIILGLLLFASVALADTTVGSLESTNGTWRAYRGTGFSTLVCSNSSEEAMLACIAADVERRATTTRYQLRYPNRYVTVRYTAPTPTCPALPATETRSATCPAGTTGTFTQTRSYTAAPYPTCSTAGAWAPSDPPAGACVVAPDPELSAPANVSAQAISTSAIRVNWDAVTGAAAYSLERCIGAACTTFSQLLCVTGLTGTHSGLPANLTARYRIRASRDAVCGTAAGNLGAYSAVVSGTTQSAPAPVDCAVSAWSAWSAGAWSACANGQQSRTETRTRTITAQPANGGAACPVLTETRTVTQACTSTGSATLSWTPPTANADGTALTNLAGYRISYGTSATALAQTVQVAVPGATAWTVNGLDPGTYYFTVRAYTSTGTESAQSNTVSKAVP